MKFKRAKSYAKMCKIQPIPEDRIAEKTWDLIDETISQTDVESLESSLLSSSQARENYVEAVNLHMDLVALFAESGAS